MKAISVRQPFAGLIVSGLKTIEFRAWPTNYRGRLVVCSSKMWSPGDYEIPEDTLWAYPTGSAVGTVDIIGCVPFTEAQLAPAIMAEMPERPGWAWQLANPAEFDLFDPVPVVGKIGIYELPDDIAAQIAEHETAK